MENIFLTSTPTGSPSSNPHGLVLPHFPLWITQLLDEYSTWRMLEERQMKLCPRERIRVKDTQRTCDRAGLLCVTRSAHPRITPPPPQNPGITPKACHNILGLRHVW
jgi:hypothetical protein